MKWVLVVIIVSANGVETKDRTYTTMTECFKARQELSVSLDMADGYMPINTQAVCLQTDVR